MQKLLFLFFALLILPVSSHSEIIPLFNRTQSSQAEALKNQYYKDVSSPQFFQVSKTAVQQILNSNFKSLELSVPLEGNANADLKLTEYNILTPGAVIMEEAAGGRITYPANVPFKCYKGVYNNDVNSMVVICFSETFVKGILLTDNNSYTLSTLVENQLTDNCILYANNKITAKNDFHCATDLLPLSDEAKKSMANFSPDRIVSNTFLQANVAIEIDRITYQIYGNSIPNASAYSLSLISVASALYNRDVNVKLVVPSIHVWTTADPYNGATSGDLLDQFRAWWNSNMQATPRTIAHFISRRSDNLGGVAWVGALCASTSTGYGYGFSNTYGNIGQLPTYSWDAMVVSHEIGHNFSSPHTHSCTWPGGPIDSCYATEGGCYTGPIIPRVGSIMSYCHLTSAGIDLRLGFGPLPKAKIRQGAESAGCLTAAPEQVLISYPQGGEIYYTNSQQYIYWGSSSTSNFNLELSTNSGSTWSSIASNIPAQQHYYIWTVPYIQGSATCKLRIIDASNPSIGDTVNSNFTIKLVLNNINLISPANQATIVTTREDLSTVVFSWSSAGSIPGINYKWKIKKLAGQYITFVSDSNGTATRFTIRKSKLDSLAVGFGLTGDSVLCAWSSVAIQNSDSTPSDVRLLTLKTNTVGINNISSVIPTEHKLYTNYPNPFNPVTKIKFEIPKDEFVKITVYDLSGKAVSYLVNERLKAGVYEADFDGSRLASGTYFYKIETNNFVETRKMVLIK